MIDIDNINLKTLFKNFVVGIMILTLLYYFISMLINLSNSYSFTSLGEFFDKKYLGMDKFTLKGTDYLDFIMNIVR